MEKTSVAMATFNGAKFIKRQLQSLSEQTRPPDELVLTDDRSTDETVAIAMEFAKTAPFPVLISVNERNLGYKENFYNAVSKCNYEIILFCDQDDIWFPTKIEKICNSFNSLPELLLLYHSAILGDENDNIIGSIRDPVRENNVLSSELPPPWFFARGLLQAFRRELTHFDDLRPSCHSHISEDVIAHDRWYLLLALAMGQIQYLDEELLLYRQHGENAYGAGATPSFTSRLRNFLAFSVVDEALATRAAKSRVEVLRELSPRISEEKRKRVNLFADQYELLAERLERRMQMHCHPKLAVRLCSFLDAVRKRDYSGRPWRFAPHSAVRDFSAGVMRLPIPKPQA